MNYTNFDQIWSPKRLSLTGKSKLGSQNPKKPDFGQFFLLGNEPNRIRWISRFRNLEIHRMRFGSLPNKKNCPKSGFLGFWEPNFDFPVSESRFGDHI